MGWKLGLYILQSNSRIWVLHEVSKSLGRSTKIWENFALKPVASVIPQLQYEQFSKQLRKIDYITYVQNNISFICKNVYLTLNYILQNKLPPPCVFVLKQFENMSFFSYFLTKLIKHLQANMSLTNTNFTEILLYNLRHIFVPAMKGLVYFFPKHRNSSILDIKNLS